MRGGRGAGAGMGWARSFIETGLFQAGIGQAGHRLRPAAHIGRMGDGGSQIAQEATRLRPAIPLPDRQTG